MHLPPSRQETLSLPKPAFLRTEVYTQLIRKKHLYTLNFARWLGKCCSFLYSQVFHLSRQVAWKKTPHQLCAYNPKRHVFKRASHRQHFCPGAPLFSPEKEDNVWELETIWYSHIAWELHFLKKDVHFSVRMNIQIYPKTNIADFFKLDF